MTPKVKVFVWRMIQGILPTGSALQCRGLEVDNRCSVCGCFGDTFAHIFIFYRLSFGVWQILDLEVMLSWADNWDNTGDWNHLFANLHEKGHVEMWMIICWLIWKNRNKCFHDKSCKVPRSIVNSAYRLKNEFEAALSAQDKTAHQPF